MPKYEATNTIGRLTFKVTGEDAIQVFEEISKTEDIFGQQTCGRCGTEDAHFVTRDIKGNHFHEMHCSNLQCGARLRISSSKQKQGHMYPCRTLMPDGRPHKDGKRDYKYNGWTLYKGSSDEQGGNGEAAEGGEAPYEGREEISKQQCDYLRSCLTEARLKEDDVCTELKLVDIASLPQEDYAQVEEYAHRALIMELIVKSKADTVKLLANYKVAKLEHIPPATLPDVIKLLRRKLEPAKSARS